MDSGEEIRADIKDLSKQIASLHNEVIELRYGKIDRNESEIKKLWVAIEDPRKIRLIIFTRIFIAIIIAILIAIFTWTAETFYKTPSPDQQKLIYELENKLAIPSSKHPRS